MRSKAKAITEIVFIVLLLIAFAISSRYAYLANQGKTLSSIRIRIKDSADYEFITKARVSGMIQPFRLYKGNTLIDSVNLLRIRNTLYKDPYVEKVCVYKNLNGELHIDIDQFIPKVRFISASHRTLFMNEEGTILPQRGFFGVDIPVVTIDDETFKIQEQTEKKDLKKSIFLQNIVNFVDHVSGDNFWNSMIVQININRQRDVELIPRAGEELILLCPLDDLGNYDLYLSKLKSFYEEMNRRELWGKYNKINLKYDNQVVCTMK